MPRAGGWTGAAQQIEQSLVLSAGLKREAIEALDWFRARLETKQRWPGWEQGRHLAMHFCVTTGGVPEGVRLHRLLVSLSDDEGTRDLVRRLGARTWHDYLGAIVELELAARLKRSGVDVSLIPASSAGASPDFRAVLHRRSIAFECAAMNDKLAAQQANHVIDRLFDFPTRHPGFRAAIAVHFTDNVLATEAFKRFDEIEACVLDAGAAGKNKHLDGLCRCEHIPGDGPPVVRPINGLGLGSWPDGEVQHLLRLVRKKIAHGQLAAEAGGVLVIRVQTLLTGYGQDPADLVDYVGALLAAAVADAPHVCAVLAYEKWLSSPIEPCEFEGDWGVGIRDADEAGVSRVAVLAGNPRAAAPLTPDEVAVLVGLTTRR